MACRFSSQGDLRERRAPERPYVLTSLYFQREDGSLRSAKFMDSMTDNPARFLSTQARDFMYVTLDETNFKPSQTSRPFPLSVRRGGGE